MSVARTVDLHEAVYRRIQELEGPMESDRELHQFLGGRKVTMAAILRILVSDGLRYREARYGIAPMDPGESTPPDPSAVE